MVACGCLWLCVKGIAPGRGKSRICYLFFSPLVDASPGFPFLPTQSQKATVLFPFPCQPLCLSGAGELRRKKQNQMELPQDMGLGNYFISTFCKRKCKTW